MKVDRDAAVELFCQLGLKTAAPKWTDEVLLGKIKTLAEIVRARGKEGVPKKGTKTFTLLAELITALKNGEQFTLTGKPAAKNPGKGKSKADEPEDDDDEPEEDDDGDEVAEDEGAESEDEPDEDDADDDSDGEDADEDGDDVDDEDGDSDDESDEGDDESDTDEGDDDVTEAPAKKPGKKKEVPATKPAKPGKPPVKEPKGKPPAKKGGDGKPGVIASIIEFIQAASKEKPIGKKEILAKLTKRFPDGDADGMMKTINAQVPNRLIAQKGLNVVKTDDKRFYIASDKKAGKAK